ANRWTKRCHRPEFCAMALPAKTPASTGGTSARSAASGYDSGNARSFRPSTSAVVANDRATDTPTTRCIADACYSAPCLRLGFRSRIGGHRGIGVVEPLPPSRARHYACTVAPLGRAHHQRFTPRLRRICVALRKTFPVPRRRYRVFFG